MSEGGEFNDGLKVAEAVRGTSIQGVGNNIIAIDDKGDRIASYELWNLVLSNEGELVSVAVGKYGTATVQTNLSCFGDCTASQTAQQVGRMQFPGAQQVAATHTGLGQYRAYERQVVWPGGQTTVPKDWVTVTCGLKEVCHRPHCSCIWPGGSRVHMAWLTPSPLENARAALARSLTDSPPTRSPTRALYLHARTRKKMGW